MDRRGESVSEWKIVFTRWRLEGWAKMWGDDDGEMRYASKWGWWWWWMERKENCILMSCWAIWWQKATISSRELLLDDFTGDTGCDFIVDKKFFLRAWVWKMRQLFTAKMTLWREQWEGENFYLQETQRCNVVNYINRWYNKLQLAGRGNKSNLRESGKNKMKK